MLSLKPEEKRRSRRHQFRGVATVVFGAGRQHYCIVKDYSDGGVGLYVTGFYLPDEFALLSPPNGPARSGNYKVVWRLGQNVGAKFVGGT